MRQYPPLPSRRTVAVLREKYEPWPVFDVATMRAHLLSVASREAPETLRVVRPEPTVAFGRQDVLRPGFSAALRVARDAGFTAFQRLTGVRTLAWHQDCIYIEHLVPDDEPQHHFADRFVEMSSIVSSTLRTLGVDARVGEVPGEPAPGAYSINARDERKLANVDQRVVDKATYVTSTIVVADAVVLRDLLVDVNEALAFEWEPIRLGSVAEEVDGVTTDDVEEALMEELASRHELVEGELTGPTRNLARALQPEHVL